MDPIMTSIEFRVAQKEEPIIELRILGEEFLPGDVIPIEGGVRSRII